MWFAALILGFAGSMHCLGMCSPLALAVTSMRRNVLLNRGLYNGGRIFTYGILGAMVSSAGSLFSLSGIQDTLSITVGMVLLAMGFAGVSKVAIPFITPGLQKIMLVLKSVFSRYLVRKNYASVFILGSLNGVLPCGLTFLALTNCLALATPLDGFSFMLLFGAGTLPAMLGLTSLISIMVAKFQWSGRKVTMALMIVSGCLLIGRVFFSHRMLSHGSEDASKEIVICR